MELRTGLRTLILPGWKPGHVPLPTVCPPLICREIEFLKKETAQRRVLEESELARKEEMDKLLDKVGPGVPRGQVPMEGAAGKPSSSIHSGSWREREGFMLLAESSESYPHQWDRRGRDHAWYPGLTPSPLCFSDLRTGRKPANTEEF